MSDMYDDVTDRLRALGYYATSDDRYNINFAIRKVTDTICNECNLDDIPSGLYYVAVDMACGEVLSIKKGSGQLTGFDTELAVKSIKAGDTQITYAVDDVNTASPVDTVIGYLLNNGKSQLVRYRRLAW